MRDGLAERVKGSEGGEEGGLSSVASGRLDARVERVLLCKAACSVVLF